MNKPEEIGIDIVYNIIEYLTVKEIIAISRVNKKYNEISRSDRIWKPLMKKMYKQQMEDEKNWWIEVTPKHLHYKHKLEVIPEKEIYRYNKDYRININNLDSYYKKYKVGYTYWLNKEEIHILMNNCVYIEIDKEKKIRVIYYTIKDKYKGKLNPDKKYSIKKYEIQINYIEIDEFNNKFVEELYKIYTHMPKINIELKYKYNTVRYLDIYKRMNIKYDIVEVIKLMKKERSIVFF